MSDVVDLPLISGRLQELDREVRLMRIQLDAIVSRFAIFEQRMASSEHGLHSLIGEVSQGFGHLHQQLTRQEKRLDAIDASLGDNRLSGDRQLAAHEEILAMTKHSQRPVASHGCSTAAVGTG